MGLSFNEFVLSSSVFTPAKNIIVYFYACLYHDKSILSCHWSICLDEHCRNICVNQFWTIQCYTFVRSNLQKFFWKWKDFIVSNSRRDSCHIKLKIESSSIPSSESMSNSNKTRFRSKDHVDQSLGLLVYSTNSHDLFDRFITVKSFLSEEKKRNRMSITSRTELDMALDVHRLFDASTWICLSNRGIKQTEAISLFIQWRDCRAEKFNLFNPSIGQTYSSRCVE
jgi:hypothetical protein